MTTDLKFANDKADIEWGKYIFLVVGVLLFLAVYYSPPWNDAVDPMGKHFPLSKEAKALWLYFC